ncbi:MAG TPA: VOC family protein [Gemmatimonadales bacterium]|nr:VOC family protein [Gemmatimonadales bacterium]
MLRRPRYVIAVPDLAASSAWYRDVLGFTVHELGDPGWRVYVLGECVIMAGECPGALAPASLGDHSYFAYLEVDDIDEFHAQVRARGAALVSTLQDEPWGMREFGVRTVDGHRMRFGARCPAGSVT